MDHAQHTAQDAVQVAAFDALPTPTIVLSDALSIVLVNRACQKVLEEPELLSGKHISDLSIDLLARSSEKFVDHLTTSLSIHRISQAQRSDVLSRSDDKLRIQFSRRHAPFTITADLLIADFTVADERFWVLTFENLKEVSEIQKRTDSNKTTSSTFSNGIPSMPVKTLPGVVSSAESDKSELNERFSRLCDAIYHNDHRSGFLLSADETFCYPNYKASQATQPVFIDNLEAFFENWNVWDSQFQQKLPLSEYPAIWLNRHQTRFNNRRYGLKEDGKNLVLEISGQPLRDSTTAEYLGGVVWITYLGEYADVAAADLKASLSSLQSICDKLPHMLWTIRSDGNADYFSQSWYDFTGLSEEESFGMGFQQAIEPKDMEGLWSDFYQATANKVDVNREARYRQNDGKWRWMNVRARPVFDIDGQILKWYGSSTDVDSLVNEREKAERKKQQIMEMLSLAEIGLFEVDSAGKLHILEGRMDWLGKQDVAQLLSEASGQNSEGMMIFTHFLRSIITDKEQTVVFEAEIRSRWYKFRLVSNNDVEGSKKVLGCSVDVTEQKEWANLEAENIRLTHTTTLEMEKNRMKTAFLAHMSHELRTPIAGIIGTAEILADTPMSSDQLDSLNDIRFLADNLLTIVNDVLDLSKIEHGSWTFEKIPFDLHEVALQARKMFSARAQAKSLDLLCKFDTSTELPMLGDPGRTRQIIVNILSNAIKFTSEGSVTMSTKIDLSHVQVVVEDTGEGIDKDTMTTLFKPFVQGDTSTARRHGGTGLGLTISRHLAKGMGGSLTLESILHKGSKAVLTLPKVPNSEKVQIRNQIASTSDLSSTTQLPIHAQQQVAKSVPRSPSSATQPLILIVEDNPVNQKVAVTLIRKLGYQTHAVWNGQEALDFCEYRVNPENYPEKSSSGSRLPSLILMDCQMPLLDGYEATRRLRSDSRFKNVKSVPIIALTASAIQGDDEKCQAAGMDGYLKKPVTKPALQATLKKWLPEG